jgi:hypothetical protein
MLQASVPNVSSVFQMYIVSVFIWMLYMFHTYVVSILSGCLQWFFSVFQFFLQVFQAHVSSVSSVFRRMLHVSSVSSVFRRMLQVLHLDISKVDRCVAYVAMVSVAAGQQPAAAPSPLLSLPSLPSISMRRIELSERDDADARRAKCPQRWWPQVGQQWFDIPRGGPAAS